MGFLVIDEAFDEWRVGKVGNGYHTLFEAWAERDLRDLIRRDRNHPSVILYSIGNEVRDQATPDGREIAEWLTSICHEEDPTRPVTAAFNNSEDAIANGLAAAVDVPGWNYKPHRYAHYHAEHPTWPMYGSETESCVSSRDEYYVPVVEERDHRRETLHVTSYDVAAPPWGYSPEYEFAALEECPAIAGEFVWTGFDYLGEPTPYKTQWPSRSAYFGILDLAGFPKDRYYLYRSRWSDEPTVHLFPHWNWPGHEGEIIPVHCYTSFAAAELFVNSRSVGRKERGTAPRPSVRATVGQMELLDRYRFRWDVPYEPGEVSVVVYDESGARAEAATVRTAGAPARLELSADRTAIAADGRDLCFVSVSVVDAAGTVCPHADNAIRFAVEGPGRLVATDNGDQTSLVPFPSSVRQAFHGRCLAILAADPGKDPGTITISATALEGVAAAGTAAAVRTEPR
jgi:beta-galactosidase